MEKPKTWGEYKRALELAGIDDNTPIARIGLELDLADIGKDRLAGILKKLEENPIPGIGHGVRAIDSKSRELEDILLDAAFTVIKGRPA